MSDPVDAAKLKRWPASLTDQRLQQQVRNVTRQLDALARRRLNTGFASHGMGMGGGLDPIQTIEHNQRVDRDANRAGLERKLAQLYDELSARGEPIDVENPRREMSSRSRLVAFVLILAVAGSVIFAASSAGRREDPGPPDIPADSWQPAAFYTATQFETPNQLRIRTSCWEQTRVDSVRETDEEIVVTIERRGSVVEFDRRTGGDENCGLIVVLRSPLGTRTVIDSARDTKIDVLRR